MRPPPQPPGDGDRHQAVGRRQRPADKGNADSHRRRKGGQPGNVNAVTHGLYARALSAKARQALQAARELPPLDLTEEIAVLRARLAALHPSDHAAFVSGVALLTRMAAVQHRLSPHDQKALFDRFTDLMKSLGLQFGLHADV